MSEIELIEEATASIVDSAARIKSQIDPTAKGRLVVVGLALKGAAAVLAGILPTGNGEEPPPPPPTGPPA